MLVVANLANTKYAKKNLAHGCSSESTQQELFNEHQPGRVEKFFKNLRILEFLVKVAYQHWKG